MGPRVPTSNGREHCLVQKIIPEWWVLSHLESHAAHPDALLTKRTNSGIHSPELPVGQSPPICNMFPSFFFSEHSPSKSREQTPLSQVWSPGNSSLDNLCYSLFLLLLPLALVTEKAHTESCHLWLFCIFLFSHEVMSDCFETPGTIAYQAPLSMGFFRQECWSGLPLPPPGQGLNRVSGTAGGFFTAEPPGKP